jgi:hypothetical protein
MREGDANDTATFVLNRTGSTAAALAVTLQPSGAATKWNDYRRPQGDMPDTFTIPAGQSSVTVTIHAPADSETEGTETGTLTIETGAAYNRGTPSSVTLTILEGSAGNDTTAPTVALTSPANNTTVSAASLTISANASDNTAVAGVQFKLNGANLGSEVGSAPYTTTLNTGTINNGTHTLTAVARDVAGNQATAATISIVVNNQSPLSTNGGFRVTLARTTNGATLTWPSTVGKTYRVSFKNSLNTNWTEISTNISASAATTTWTDPGATTVPQRFYRVRQTN